jgi:hypothetical protein
LRCSWKFLVRMDAAFFNPVLNVRVENAKRKGRSLQFPDLVKPRPSTRNTQILGVKNGKPR